MKRLKMLVAVTLNLRPALVSALALLLAGQGVVLAGSTPFSRIIVFGDSVSDTGNFYRMSGELWGSAWAYPPSHLTGRAAFPMAQCGSSIWPRTLGWQHYKTDYAVGGATTAPRIMALRSEACRTSSRSTCRRTRAIRTPCNPMAGHNDVFLH